jgi:two-component system OmpR family response regulator
VATARERLLGIHVLLVEDHEDTRDMYAQALTAAGAVVDLARSAQDAALLLNTADVVVTDVAMPGEDGICLLEQIRAKTSRLPVIAVSGYVKEQDQRLARANFDVLLLKPVDPWRLCEEIEMLLSKSSSRA